MKIFSCLFATETNTFAPAPTGWGSFHEHVIYRGDASKRASKGFGIYMAEMERLLAAEGHELVESVTAFAQPLGRTVREVYESLRDDILEDLRAAGSVGAVILVLHGAMVAEGYDDCEGDLLERVRAIVGPDVPIGVELDLHCHFTERMRRNADTIICFKEYPHVDAVPRMKELIRIVLDTASAKVRPTTAVFDCKMVGLWFTTREPMISFVKRMQEVEQRPGVLSVSLGHGFPWADVPESGCKLWVVTDNDPALAAAVAEELGREFWDLREQTVIPTMSADQAMKAALAVQGGPVVMADIADNPGGGAMSDSTFLLRAVLDRGIADTAFGFFWDLGAVRICADAGVGAQVALRVGGKCGPASGDPVDLPVVVKAIIDDHVQIGMGGGEERTPLGQTVWVQAANGMDIVLVSIRGQVFSPKAFTDLGINLAGKKLIVLKSTQHFHAQFAPIAKEVLYVTTPGAKDMNFGRLPYTARSLDYWPRVADPHGFDKPANAEVTAPGQLYVIDGLRLHLHRSGPAPTRHGLPTVVIESGAGTSAAVYSRLQKALATKYPVCSYDRPGLGWSEADSQPLDARRNAHRLHALLAAAGVSGPILLIGHSLGGPLARVYAEAYPEQVVGLMMLDASHPDQFAMMDGLMDDQLAAEREKRAKVRDGGPPPPELAMVEAVFADMPEVIAQLKAQYRPEVIDAMALEMRGKAEIARQAAASGDLGARPLAVLWAPQTVVPGAPAAIAEIQRRWPDYQQAHAALSSRGRVMMLEGATHMGIAVLPPFVARVVEEIDGIMAQLGTP
ncbi:alpha/beta fold hydrolase [Roseateles toxinivorans]|uniref:Microcystin degradation protein MlrC n=1 Tax=Roseateles toxinivorans TaxID=270368 RepID=A0A4R6QQ66_9BURK|nr:alpha/beta fold hydrolase [Roseateles toxinivorans]TDP71781.1 microcystin degradation protein MlrC [Roseateles toxinivorans]